MAKLPEGWRKRLVAYESPATNGVKALCLEPHDLWLSKAVAGRQKDLEFCRALLQRRLVKQEILRQRLKKMSAVDPQVADRVAALIESNRPE